MKNRILLSAITVLAVGSFTLAPSVANAQSWQHHHHSQSHRRDTEHQWQSIAYGAGALGVLGLLTHDNTLFFAGAAGALYSTSRMEDDRRSADRSDRLRAEYFNHPYFIRDGERYDRETVNRHGQRYYRFRRHRW